MDEKFVDALKKLFDVNAKLHELHGERLDSLENRMSKVEACVGACFDGV